VAEETRSDGATNRGAADAIRDVIAYDFAAKLRAGEGGEMAERTTTNEGTCRLVHDFPNGGYTVIGDEEPWEPVVRAARVVERIGSATYWNVEWEDVYGVLPRDSTRYRYYFVRSQPGAAKIPLPQFRGQ
jgi:hypothetical protein